MVLRRSQPTDIEKPEDVFGLFDEPVISIPDRDEPNKWHHFSSEEEADAWTTSEDIERARAAAGAWSDIDHDDMMGGLSLIRQSIVPTRPIEVDWDEEAWDVTCWIQVRSVPTSKVSLPR